VQRVVSGIQAKLKVGQPCDIYEQEVDQMAEPSRIWAGAMGDQMRAIRGLHIRSFLTVLQKEVANPMTQSWQRLSPHRKMAVDLSNRFVRRRHACRCYDQRGEPAIRQISGKDHLNSR
jgi:hypothetical protein